MWAAADKKLANPCNFFLQQNRIWKLCNAMSCQQDSYLFILPGNCSSPAGTIWKSCRWNLSKIVACLSCIKHHFIEFVCVVCCSIDKSIPKVKETVGVDVVFSSCTKTRLMQAVNGWVAFGLPPKCFVRFCSAGNRQTNFGFKKECRGHTWLCYLGLGEVVHLLALNTLASGIGYPSLGSLNALHITPGVTTHSIVLLLPVSFQPGPELLFTGRHNSKSR